MDSTRDTAPGPARPRTIVQITPYYPPHLGGLERVVQRLSQEQAKRHEVRVVTTGIGAEGALHRYQQGSLTVHRHRAVEWAHTAVSPGLPLSLLRAPRSSVLHLHSAHALIPELVALTARLRGQRFLLHFHLDVDGSGPLGVLLPAYKKHVFGRVARAAAGVVALTGAQADFVREAYRVPADRIFVVPNGVGEEFFRPPREPEDRPLELLFVGRLNPQKGVDRLLDALSRTARPVRLRIVGDGELRGPLEARARELGLEDVSFSGALHGRDLLDAYTRADVFVLPSEKEGMPLVALEAMAASLPVVATDVPGNAELLRGVGLLVAPDAAELAAAIDRVAADPELRRQLAGRSAAAARGHSWAAVAEQVEQVYTKVFG